MASSVQCDYLELRKLTPRKEISPDRATLYVALGISALFSAIVLLIR
jgi:hypothetical protein